MLVLAVLVVPFLPWFTAWGLLHDAWRYLRLARWPAPLGEPGVAELLARLEREAPLRVERIEAEASTGMAADEPLWSAVLVRFVDRSTHAVSARPSCDRPDAGSLVVRAATAHGVTVREVTLAEKRGALSEMFVYAAVIVWAVALGLLVSPWTSSIAILPLPVSRLLRAVARRAAERMIPESAR